jgi:hypothetical protein
VTSPDSSAPPLSAIVRALRDSGVGRFAFTGAVAQGVWVRPRQSRDVDVVGEASASAADRLLALRNGMRSGPSEIPDLVRFRVGDWDVDLFVAKGAYYQASLDRAVAVDADNERILVVTPEDLAIQKMLKLRTDRRRVFQDVADLRALIETLAERFDWPYVERWLRPDEALLLREIRGLDDDALLGRLARAT